MAIFIFMLLFFGTWYAINRFALDSAISVGFIGRMSLVFILFFAGIMHLQDALAMNDMTENASEAKRNLVFFAGVFELMFAVGLTFVITLKWSSIVAIGFLFILIVVNLTGFLREFTFSQLGKAVEFPYILLEYLVIIIWAAIFGIIYREDKGIIGLKGKGW